jgi:hypothetical protein
VAAREQAEWHCLGSVAVSFVCSSTTDPLSMPLHLREFYLYLTLSTTLQYISVQEPLEQAEWRVCMQNQGNLHSSRSNKFRCAYMPRSWPLSRSTPPTVVHQPPLQQRFALNPKASHTAGIRFKEPLVALHISTLPIIPSKIPTAPPFVIDSPHCGTLLCDFPKACTPPDSLQRLCTEMFTHYADYAVVLQMGLWWTDQQVVLLFWMETLLNFDWTVIFTADLLALCKALEAVSKLLSGNFLMCTDSLSAVQGLRSPDLTHPLIFELCMTWHTLLTGYNITVAWIQDHVGISSNEAEGTLVPGVLSLDLRLPSVNVSWPNGNRTGTKHRATSCKTWSHWHSHGKSSRNSVRQDKVVVTRLRVVHICLTRSHLVSASLTPVCAPCHVELRNLVSDTSW